MENILPDAGKLLEISLQYEERAIGDRPLLHNFSICSSPKKCAKGVRPQLHYFAYFAYKCFVLPIK